MKWHPSLGYFDEGFDLTAPELFDRCGRNSARRGFCIRSLIVQKPLLIWRTRRFGPVRGSVSACISGSPATAIFCRIQWAIMAFMFSVTTKDNCKGVSTRPSTVVVATIPLQCQSGKKTKCSFTSCGYSRDRDVMSAAELNDSAPAMGQYLGFNPAKLVSIKVETWGPFVFVNLDTEARPLVEQFDDLTNKIGSCLRGIAILAGATSSPPQTGRWWGRIF